MFLFETATKTCRFIATFRTTLQRSASPASHPTGKSPAGGAIYRNARGVGPLRSRGAIAAQLPLSSPSPIGPSLRTTPLAESKVSVVNILFGSSARETYVSPYHGFPGNPFAASAIAPPAFHEEKHFDGSTLNVAPERWRSSCAGNRSSSLRATSASTALSFPVASHSASLRDSSVACINTSDEST
eukprot:31198-Pelagococcus_subviridis.AAC.55